MKEVFSIGHFHFVAIFKQNLVLTKIFAKLSLKKKEIPLQHAFANQHKALISSSLLIQEDFKV